MAVMTVGHPASCRGRYRGQPAEFIADATLAATRGGS